VTASFTTPASVTVTALVAEMRIYSVKTCNMKNNQLLKLNNAERITPTIREVHQNTQKKKI